MFWFANNRRDITVVGIVVCVASPLAGCARPQGILFPAIQPPRVWPPPPDVARIKLIGALTDSRGLKAAIPSSEALRAAFRGPRPPIKFSGPHGVAVRGSDWVAVADGTGGAVHILNLMSRTHRVVTGFDEERFLAPLGVTWADGRLFVADAGRGEVIELDAQGGFLKRFGRDVLQRPVGIAYSSQRKQLFVVDGSKHHLVVFDLDGHVTGTIGGRGVAPGKFNYPTQVCCVGDRLLVADSGNFRVQLFDLDGQPLAQVGHNGDGAGDLPLPKGVALDREGRMYVVDARFENVQIFDETGRLLMAFGEGGAGLGQFSLPAGLTIDQQDRIWVADSGNRRLQVFQLIRAHS